MLNAKEILINNDLIEENNLIKCKMALYCRVASSDNWMDGREIYISCRKDNYLFLNDPSIKGDAVSKDNIVDMEISSKTLDKYGDHIPDFILHFLLHNLKTEYTCVTFIECASIIEKIGNMGGLYPISQESMLIGGDNIDTFDYESYVLDLAVNRNDEEKLNTFLIGQRKILEKALQRNNKLFLKNHGFMVMGNSVEECWYIVFQMLYAIKTHVKLDWAFTSGNVLFPSEEVQKLVRSFDIKGQSEQVSMNKKEGIPSFSNGQLEFQAVTRCLENLTVSSCCNYDLQKTE